jgi:glycosyltransferase involved in cell wall biosynthesis
VRVALLVTDLERGGTPLRLVRQGRALREAGATVAVGCLAPPGPLTAELEHAGVRTFACGARGPRDVTALRSLLAFLRRWRPDILHTTLTHANLAGRCAGWVLGLPVVSSTATIEVERRWQVWAERLTARLDQGHIVNSRALAEHVARTFRVPRARLHVIPPAIAAWQRTDPQQARAALGIPPHEFVVLWFGRFDPVKRLDMLVRCAEIMAAVPSRFLLAGDGPHRPAIDLALRLSSAARNVHLLGWRSDMGPLLAAADVLLLPSLTEGLPNAVLEAMAAGVPVVGADLPALRELSAGSRRALLVQDASPKAFAEALLWLRENPARRTALAAAAREWAAQFEPSGVAQALLGVYARVIRDYAGRAGNSRSVRGAPPPPERRSESPL